jgi:hypothetical protein
VSIVSDNKYDMHYLIFGVTYLIAARYAFGDILSFEGAVVYIHKERSIPPFMYLTIELASRKNHVVIISDVSESISKKSQWENVSYIPIKAHFSEAEEFSKIYVHMALDKSESRKAYELVCLQRWFVLKSFMTKYSVEQVFYGDSDTVVFLNMKEVYAARKHCDAVISVEVQKSSIIRGVSGHASMWTLQAITDFSRFLTDLYANHMDILSVGRSHGVSDMTSLWYWWVWHLDTPGWKGGRPWDALSMWRSNASMQDIRVDSDNAYKVSREMLSKARGSGSGSGSGKLTVCNGLDVVNRLVLDHMHGWSETQGFTFNLLESGAMVGVPSITGPCLKRGGAPEDITPTTPISQTTSRYDHEKLYFAVLHYQGNTKDFMTYDICRNLQLTGSRTIVNIHNRVMCKASLDRHAGLPCRKHTVIGRGSDASVCA